MKTKISHTAASKAASFTICALAAIMPCHAAKPVDLGGTTTYIPAVPSGWLSAYPTVVQTGTHPKLTWSITYPSTVTTYATVDSSNEVTTKDQLDVDVKVIGTGVTTGGCDGTNTNWVPAQALLSVDGGSPVSLFYGTNTEVKPDALVWSKRVRAGTTFRFGGRYFAGGKWSTTYMSSQSSNNIRVLKNGEYPPTAYALSSSDSLKSFMQPYLDGAGRIKIGPLDFIVMMELTQDDANINSPCYNLQDVVLLMTCKPKNNNGHGNNIDGVDSSNPGNSKPVDPSGTVDDEK